MYLNVLTIRQPSDEELYATSAVWLTGVVVEPPRFMRHPELPDVQLAITVVEVTLERPSPMPGSRAITSMPARVRLAIPTSHQQAAYLYRAGNQVCIEGQVDCITETQGGAAVEAQVEKLRADWAAQQAELATKSEQEQRNAERAYRRARAAFLEVPRVQVLAGYVELLAGEEATMYEARAMRRVHIEQMRNRRSANRQMRTHASGNGRGPAMAEIGLEMIVMPLEQRQSTTLPVAEAAGLVQPVRARQRRERAASIADTSSGNTVFEGIIGVEETLTTEAAHIDDAADSVTLLPVEQVLTTTPAE